MTDPAEERARTGLPRAIGAGVVVAATLVTLGIGYLWKLPCVTGPGLDRELGWVPCYTDILPFWTSEGLDRGELPYLSADTEYPVLTGVALALAAVPSDGPAEFFHWTVLLLAGGAIGTSLALRRLTGSRALYFALAPTLLLSGFINWDLLAVLFATLGTAAYLRRRHAAAGAWLGLGTATKLFPGFFVLPFAEGRRDDRRAMVRLVAAAVLTWLVVNVPVMLAAPGGWWRFFGLSAQRGATWDTVWFIAARHLQFEWSPRVLNVVSAGAFLAVLLVLWTVKSKREPGFPAWTFGFAMLVAFVLTNKVYSPQYSLWLLPWFALVLPDVRLFAAFQLADIGVFWTEFRWLASVQEVPTAGIPYWPLEAFLLLRAAILVACVVAWVRRPADRTAELLASPADTARARGRESTP